MGNEGPTIGDVCKVVRADQDGIRNALLEHEVGEASSASQSAICLLGLLGRHRIVLEDGSGRRAIKVTPLALRGDSGREAKPEDDPVASLIVEAWNGVRQRIGVCHSSHLGRKSISCAQLVYARLITS